jgi:hypothetical protein
VFWSVSPCGLVGWYISTKQHCSRNLQLTDVYVDNTTHKSLSISARRIQYLIGTNIYTSFTRAHGTCPTLYIITLAPRRMQWPLAQCGSSCGDLSLILIFHLLIAGDVQSACQRARNCTAHFGRRSYSNSAHSSPLKLVFFLAEQCTWDV